MPALAVASVAFLLTVTAGPPRFQDTDVAYQAVVGGSLDECLSEGAKLGYILSGQQMTRDLDRNGGNYYYLPAGTFRWRCDEIDPNRIDRDQG